MIPLLLISILGISQNETIQQYNDRIKKKDSIERKAHPSYFITEKQRKLDSVNGITYTVVKIDSCHKCTCAISAIVKRTDGLGRKPWKVPFQKAPFKIGDKIIYKQGYFFNGKKLSQICI